MTALPDSDSSMETSQGRAIPILNIEEKRIEIDAKAFNFVLDKVGDRPFVIFSISGATRTGKSYALNHFLRFFEWRKRRNNSSAYPGQVSEEDWWKFILESQFVSQGGRERKTVGINLWSEPYFVKTSDESEIAVLLMDTQGLFDEQTTIRENAIIFAISTFCSSVMIFNIMRIINDDFLQQIEYFSNYAKAIPLLRCQDEEGEGRNTSSGDFSESVSDNANNSLQSLLFLLRDFDLLEYEYGHHTINSNPGEGKQNYLVDTFNPDKGDSKIPEENKIVRKKILENFQDVSMFLLPDPGKKFRRQRQEENESCSIQPEEDFQKNLQQFVELMTCDQQLLHYRKSVGGKHVTGLEFKELMSRLNELCVRLDEIFKNLRTPAENAALLQYSIALRTAISSYQEKMDNFICSSESDSDIGGISDEKLTQAHAIGEESAQKIFKGMIRMRNDKFQEKFGEELNTTISRIYNELLDQYNILKEKTKHAREMQNEAIRMAKELSDLKAKKGQILEKLKASEGQKLMEGAAFSPPGFQSQGSMEVDNSKSDSNPHLIPAGFDNSDLNSTQALQHEYKELTIKIHEMETQKLHTPLQNTSSGNIDAEFSFAVTALSDREKAEWRVSLKLQFDKIMKKCLKFILSKFKLETEWQTQASSSYN